MKRTRMRSLLAVALALLLTLTMMPAAFAEGEDTSTSATVADAAALSTALSNTNVTTITLRTDITSSITIPEGKSITLDLNGHKLTNTAGEHTITNNGTLTLTGNGTVDNVTHAKAALLNNGTAILNGVTVTRSAEAGSSSSSNGGNSYYYIHNTSTGTLTINEGCSVPGTSHYSSTIRNDHEMVINGGSISTGGFIAVKNDEGGNLTVNGGTIDGGGDQAIQNWCNVTINGGTMSNGGVVTWGAQQWNAYGATTINGGVVESCMVVAYDAGLTEKNKPTLTINEGATITGDVSAAYTSSTTRDNAYAGINITGGAVVGDLYNNLGNGTLTISDGSFDGQVYDNNANGNGVTAISGGTFTQQPAVALIATDAAAIQVDGGAYIIGTPEQVANAAANANESVTVVKATEGLVLSNVDSGVTVTNQDADTPITVNGVAVSASGSYVVPTYTIYYPDYDETPTAPAEPAQPAAQQYVVICRKLNVRAGASTAASKIGSLARGETVTGVAEDGWVRFTDADGRTAYISAAYVRPADGSQTLTVVCRKLNVREGAGTGYARIGSLSRGEAVEVLDTVNGWHKIAYGNGVGWVCAKYVG